MQPSRKHSKAANCSTVQTNQPWKKRYGSVAVADDEDVTEGNNPSDFGLDQSEKMANSCFDLELRVQWRNLDLLSGWWKSQKVEPRSTTKGDWTDVATIIYQHGDTTLSSWYSRLRKYPFCILELGYNALEPSNPLYIPLICTLENYMRM